MKRYQRIKMGILASLMWAAVFWQSNCALASMAEEEAPPMQETMDSIDPGEDKGFNGTPGRMEIYGAEKEPAMGSMTRRAIGKARGWDAGGLELSGTVYARTYNEDGDTLSDVFGFEKSRLLSWMHEQASTGYYLDTVYDGGDNRNPNGDPAYNGRDVSPGQAGLNCTGFVWHMLMKAGARVTGESDGKNTSFVNNTAALQAAGANVDNSGTNPVVPGESGWVSFLAGSNVEYKTYISDNWDDMVRVLVADDYWDAGDVIWMWDLKNPLVSGVGGNNGKFPNAETAQRLFFTEGMYGHAASGLSWGNSVRNHILLYCGVGFVQYSERATNNYAQYVSGVAEQLVWHSSDVHFNYQTWLPDDSTPWNQITSLFPKESGGPYAVTIVKTGESTGKLKLKKTSADQGFIGGNQCYSLAGAVYGVYRTREDAGNQTARLATLTTNENGETEEVELDEGTYYVKEITAPKGYTLDVNIHQAVVESGRTATVQSSEPPQKLRIRLNKVDAETGLSKPQGTATLAGAVYGIYDSSGNKVDELTTDAAGTAVSKELPLGDYTVRETTASKGYLIDEKTYTVSGSVPKDTTTQVFEYGVTSAEVPQKIRIRLKKTDAETKKGEPQGAATLAGAVYGVYDSSGNKVDELTTDVAGTAVSKELPLGDYTVRETTASKGYLIDEKTYKVSGSVPKDTTTRVFEYGVTSAEVPQKIRIRLKKTDAETKKGEPQGAAALAGAVYGIYDSSGNKVDELVTDAAGTAVSKELPLDDYTVKENNASEGYLVDGQGHAVNAGVPKDATTRVFEYETESGEDVIRGDVEIIKLLENTDEDDDTIKGLSGIEFTFTSKTTGKETLTITTDENGFATTALGEQPRGALVYDTYTVTETKYPEGVKPIEAFDVTISREGVTLKGIYKEDKLIVSPVTVVKRDAGTGRNIPAAGVEFRLLDENKEPVTMTTRYPGKEVHETFKTDEDGQFTFPDMLKCGTYYIEELNAPKGYLKGELLEFKVEDGATWEHPLVVEYADENVMGKIRIEKTGMKKINDKASDIENAEVEEPNLENAGMEEPDLENAGMEEPDLENAGMEEPDLENAGMEEPDTENADGEAGKEADADEEENGENADGEKEDGEKPNEETAGDETKLPLDGAEFEIVAAEDIVTPDGTVRALEGEVVDTVTTVQGAAESKPLFLGRYVVRETVQPEGYVLKDEVYEVMLEYQDQDTAIVERMLKIENHPSRFRLYKIDKDTKEALPGVEFEFWKKTEPDENNEPDEETKGTTEPSTDDVSEETDGPGVDDVSEEMDGPGVDDMSEETDGPGVDDMSEETDGPSADAVSEETDGSDADAVSEENESGEEMKTDEEGGLAEDDSKEETQSEGEPGDETEVVSDEKELPERKIVITNEDGMLELSYLTPGTYCFQETKTAEGYVLNDTIYEIVVGDDGRIDGQEVGILYVENEKEEEKPEMPKEPRIPEIPEETKTPEPEIPKPETPEPETPEPEIPKPETPEPEIPKPEIPEPEIPEPEVPEPEIPEPRPEEPETPAIQTGDVGKWMFYLILMGLSAAVVGWGTLHKKIHKRRRRKPRRNKK